MLRGSEGEKGGKWIVGAGKKVVVGELYADCTLRGEGGGGLLTASTASLERLPYCITSPRLPVVCPETSSSPLLVYSSTEPYPATWFSSVKAVGAKTGRKSDKL